METNTFNKKAGVLKYLLLLLSCYSVSNADTVMDWNVTARTLVVESKLYTPPANRVMAIVHTAIHEAVKAVNPENAIAIESAIAAASYTSLMGLLPNQKSDVETAYLNALKSIPEGVAREAGIEAGKQAAQTILAARNNDGFDQIESYRPYTAAGNYVPTVIPAVPHWPQRQTWMLDNAEQFRPGPPPELKSEVWTKDLNEVKALGAYNSTTRTTEQTEIAKFWEATLPPIYHGVIHSVASQKGRTVIQNARLFALVTQATDDAMIAVFDAKYHYSLWRPITAIRNADKDNNNKTERDASWKPFIPTPMHPEYPCAHCVVAGTVGAIIKAEIGDGPMPLLTTRSDTANNSQRSWSSVDDFVQEVTNARIYDGVHYRTSGDVGAAMGKKIGELAVKSNAL